MGRPEAAVKPGLHRLPTHTPPRFIHSRIATMNTIARIGPVSPAMLHGHLAAAARAWQRLTRVERVAVVAAVVVAAGLLLALVQACEASVLRGERLRAEQRQANALRSTPGPTTVAALHGIAAR